VVAREAAATQLATASMERCAALEAQVKNCEERCSDLIASLADERAARQNDIQQLRKELMTDLGKCIKQSGDMENLCSEDPSTYVQECFAGLLKSANRLQQSVELLRRESTEKGSSCCSPGGQKQLGSILEISSKLVRVLNSEETSPVPAGKAVDSEFWAGVETRSDLGRSNCGARSARSNSFDSLDDMATAPSATLLTTHSSRFALNDADTSEGSPCSSTIAGACCEVTSGSSWRGQSTAASIRGSSFSMSQDSGNTRCYFSVSCDRTQPGMHVRVVGSCFELGDWNPGKGLVLATSEASFPAWKNENPLRVQGENSIEYKFVMCDDEATNVQWEEGPNRKLCLASFAEPSVLVSETFDIHGDTVVDRLPESSTPGMGATQGTTLKAEALAMQSERSTADNNWTRMGELGLSLIREESTVSVRPSEHEGDADEDVTGQTFNAKYNILGEKAIGAGSFGSVWCCVRKEGSDPTRLAAKIVRKCRLHPRDFTNLLGHRGEIQTHMTLKHPNIIELYEHFDDDEAVIMIMERCFGGDLFDAIDLAVTRHPTHGLSEKAGARMMSHLFAALTYLHSRRIVHRDLKTENILLVHGGLEPEENHYKLCDFGFTAEDNETCTGLSDRVGSPFTVAPEVVEGIAYGRPVDMWSAGVMMYMTLSGYAPFNGSTSGEVLQQVARGTCRLEGPFWGSVAPICRELLTSLLNKDASARPTARSAAVHPWITSLC